MAADPRLQSMSVDLVQGAAHQLAFLKQVSDEAKLQDPAILRQALDRYERLWLPLAAKHASEILPGPLDVEWVWHCHLLAPVAYQQDCTALVGKVVDHQLFSEKERNKRILKSKHLWQEEYPNEPFEVDLKRSAGADSASGVTSQISYDILTAAARQKVFYYQVSLTHYRDAKFLNYSLGRYRKFLYLKQQNPSLFIVPCYDIDLLWHTHMLHPLLYKTDMMTFLGKPFPHDDSVNDRSDGSRLNTSQKETQDLWVGAFGENFMLYGAMYRGDPPQGKLYTMTTQHYYDLATKSCHVRFERIELKNIPQMNGKLKLKLYTSANNKIKTAFATLQGEPLWQQKNVAEVNFDTKDVNCVKFRVIEQSGFACFGSKMVIAENEFNLLPIINASNSNQPTSLEKSVTLGQDNQSELNFKAHLSPPKRGPILLVLQASNFSQAVMPENIESMWGPVPMRNLPPGTENKCEVASHRLVNHTGAVMFTCRIIHSLPLLQSVVHIFYQDKMSAVAHLVGSDTLPLPTQVQNPKKAVYLNPVAGERAVVVKNNTGDWAFVVGRWKGYKRGVPGVAGTRYQRGRPGQPGSSGTLLVRVWFCHEGQWRSMELPYLYKKFVFTCDGLTVNLSNGAIEVAAGSGEVAEKLALAFSVSLLHVLCQPRPKAWTPGQSLRPTASRGSRQVSYVPSEDMTFMMAAGFLMATPSNHYIRNNPQSACGYGVYVGEVVVPEGMECGVTDGIGGEWGEVGGEEAAGDLGVADAGGDGGGAGGADGGDAGGCGGCGGCGACGGGGCGGGGGGCGGGGCGGCGGCGG
ncbi:uncharacterized protein [Littorina saxatilis]|uniref:Uncharacterized protein n=1 Tax=Littorina saxatilis TaxID=31220 RepID=A0AAN9BAN0_9CAEN